MAGLTTSVPMCASMHGCREASKYTGNSRIIAIQTAMAERCLELLHFSDDGPKMILDIGCGSGLSGGGCPDAAALMRFSRDGRHG